MIWGDDISFEGFQRIVDEWYRDKDFELCDPPINAQYALGFHSGVVMYIKWQG